MKGKSMKTIALMSVAAAMIAGSLRVDAEEPEAPTKFGGGIRVPSNFGYSVSVSPDHQVMTVIFDNLVQSLEPARKGTSGVSNQTASESKVFSMQVPYETGARSVKMYFDVRGFVSSENDDDVKLVIHAGNATKVVNLFGEAKGRGADAVKHKGHIKADLLATREPPSSRSGDFFERIEFTVQVRSAKPSVPITLFLLTEHDTEVDGAGGALLAIDSLDLSFGETGKGKYRQ